MSTSPESPLSLSPASDRRKDEHGSTDTEIMLKFLFAHREGVHAVLPFPKTSLVSHVKSELQRHWPQDLGEAPPISNIRLICMGRGMLQDKKSLEASKIPAFSTHPTPVNVSISKKEPPPPPHDSEKTHTRLSTDLDVSRCGCILL